MPCDEVGGRRGVKEQIHPVVAGALFWWCPPPLFKCFRSLCPYYMVKHNNTQQICKHILRVYLLVLKNPEESQLINQVALLQSEVLESTSNALAVIPPPPLLFKTSSASETFAQKNKFISK